jgi:energy-coupling factor transporter ATP-binding protein EcfA2
MASIASVGSEAIRLDKARQALAALLGVREEVSGRLESLTTQVAVAKGRIALKPEIDSFLEELQAEAHKRNVGSFERLLTLLVQDVLPGSSPIGLELSTERGLPSLDIFARLDGDLREDIFDDQGGAITNIVSAGLRLIAVVKSGGRRLIVADEPDCWLKPDRIPDFYRVFRQAAEQVGIQCLVISHHSHALFGEGIEVARLESHDGESTIVSSPSAHRTWRDDTPGFRAIRLTDFQQHRSSELLLSPGVTALIGPNNRGKSSLVRALAAALYGDCRESLIRHGSASCTVAIDVEDGRRLTYTRHRRRNPVNMWALTGPDGAVVQEGEVRYETGGRAVPDWVAAKFGVAPVDDLRIHIANQKAPVFLLSDPPQRRASVLSVGQETSHLREMIVVQRERMVRDQQTVRDGEREVSSLQLRLASLETAAAIEPEIDAAAAFLEALRAGIGRAEDLESAIAAIETAESALLVDRQRLLAIADLPPDGERDRLVAALNASSECADLINRIEDLVHGLEAAGDRLEALEGLPDAPVLAPGDEPAALARLIEDARTRRDQLSSRLAILDELPGDTPVLRLSEEITLLGRQIGEARARRDKLASTLAILQGLPDDPPALKPSQEAAAICDAIEEARARREVLISTLAVLDGLPDEAPALRSSEEITIIGREIAAAHAAVESAHGRLAEVQRDLGEVEAETAQLLETMGSLCPTCGQQVSDVDAFLRDVHTSEVA